MCSNARTSPSHKSLLRWQNFNVGKEVLTIKPPQGGYYAILCQEDWYLQHVSI